MSTFVECLKSVLFYYLSKKCPKLLCLKFVRLKSVRLKCVRLKNVAVPSNLLIVLIVEMNGLPEGGGDDGGGETERGVLVA